MADQPLGHLDNTSLNGRFKQYSRPINYTKRQSPQILSDVSDQFTQLNQAKLNSMSPKPLQTQPNQVQSPLRTMPQSINPTNQIQQPVPKTQAPLQVTPQTARTLQPQQLTTAVNPLQINRVVQQPAIQQAPVQPLLQTTQIAEPANPIVNEVASVAFVQEQQQNVPVYLNNYNGEYEDKKYKRFSPKNLKFNKIPLILSSGISLTLVLAGAFFLYINWNNNRNVAQAQSLKNNSSQTSNNNANYASTDIPSQTQVNNYAVGPNDPKYLIIPKLNIFSMITPISLNDQNYLSAPTNIHNVGWWKSSSQPGQPGATVLDGFTSNGIVGGALYNLVKLPPGSTFEIQTGSNTKYTYKVDSTTLFTKNGLTMDQAISPYSQKKSGLNIITCSGLTSTCPTSLNADYVVFSELVN